MKKIDQTTMIGQLAGANGDIYIGTDAVERKLTHIIVGADGATLTDIKIRGVSVKADRAYPDELLAGDILCAGDDDFFDYIKLSAGSAKGLLLPVPVTLSALAATLADGYSGNAATLTIGFANAGNSGSKYVLWKIVDGEGTTLSSGDQPLYLIRGTEKSITISTTYPAVTVEDEACVLMFSFDNGETWVNSDDVTITPITPSISAVSADNGASNDPMTASITHTTSGTGTITVYYKITATDTTVLDSGTVDVAVEDGTDQTASITGLTYPEVAVTDEGVVLSVSLDDETYVDSSAFTITAPEE